MRLLGGLCATFEALYYVSPAQHVSARKQQIYEINMSFHNLDQNLSYEEDAQHKPVCVRHYVTARTRVI